MSGAGEGEVVSKEVGKEEIGEEDRGARGGLVRESRLKPRPNPREPNPKPTPQTRTKVRRCRWKRHGLERCALIRKPV